MHAPRRQKAAPRSDPDSVLHRVLEAAIGLRRQSPPEAGNEIGGAGGARKVRIPIAEKERPAAITSSHSFPRKGAKRHA